MMEISGSVMSQSRGDRRGKVRGTGAKLRCRITPRHEEVYEVALFCVRGLYHSGGTVTPL